MGELSATELYNAFGVAWVVMCVVISVSIIVLMVAYFVDKGGRK